MTNETVVSRITRILEKTRNIRGIRTQCKSDKLDEIVSTLTSTAPPIETPLLPPSHKQQLLDKAAALAAKQPKPNSN